MTELSAIENLAEGYRRRGYEVILKPRGTAVPEFLGDFEPDMIAKKGEEFVVIEVTTHSELATDTRLPLVAEELQARHGWRLDVVVEGEDSPWPDYVRDAVEPTLNQIGSMIQSAKRLAALGEMDAACLIGWAAIEAAMRALAEVNGIRLERNAPGLVLKQLYSLALLSREDYRSLEEAMRVRNAVAHGLKPRRLTSDAAPMLVDTAARLLASLSRTAA